MYQNLRLTHFVWKVRPFRPLECTLSECHFSHLPTQREGERERGRERRKELYSFNRSGLLKLDFLLLRKVESFLRTMEIGFSFLPRLIVTIRPWETGTCFVFVSVANGN